MGFGGPRGPLLEGFSGNRIPRRVTSIIWSTRSRHTRVISLERGLWSGCYELGGFCGTRRQLRVTPEFFKFGRFLTRLEMVLAILRKRVVLLYSGLWPQDRLRLQATI